MLQHIDHRCASLLTASLWFTLSLEAPRAQGQDSAATRRVQLRTFSIESPASEDWTTTACPDRDSVQFVRTTKKTLGLFGTDQRLALVVSRIDARYTLAGEMLSKEEAAKYYRSYFEDLFVRKLPRRGLSLTAVERPSINLGGKDFQGVKVTHTWDGGSSAGEMYDYFPPDYSSRKASYRFVVNDIGQAGLVAWGGQPFKAEDVLASFTPHSPLEAYEGDAGSLLRAAASGDSALVRVLVDKGANVDSCTPEGTPLTLAARSGHLSIVQYLMAKGAGQKPEVCGKQDTPLHAAISGRAMDVARYLLNHGASVNAAVRGSWTPLMQAVCAKSDTSFLSLLVRSGAKVDAQEEHGITPLYMAAYNGAADVVGLLLDHGATASPTKAEDVSPFMLAVGRGNLQVVKVMLERGFDPNEHRSTGWSVLMQAASTGQLEIVKALLEKGATLNATDENDRSALFAAITEKHAPVALFFIEKGADVNARFGKGFTPLMLAAASGDTLVVRALIEHQADLDVKNDNGHTALEIADDKDHDAVVKQLKAAGAKE
jgi:ankyrin repeat protein